MVSLSRFIRKHWQLNYQTALYHFCVRRNFSLIIRDTLEAFYRPDFVCFNEVIVELKALSQLSSVEESQVINYLKVTGYHTALLLNFGSRSLENVDSSCRPRLTREIDRRVNWLHCSLVLCLLVYRSTGYCFESE